MGNSLSYVDPKHATIWNKLCELSNNQSRYVMIEKILVHPEYVTAAKYAGIYAHIVDWKSKFEKLLKIFASSPDCVNNPLL